MRIFYFYSIIALLALLSGCAIEQNTFTANLYHNTASHYNGYYYAQEEIKKIEKILSEHLDDNYNHIALLYPRIDTLLANTYDKNIKEAIKMGSLSIQRHPNSKWVYNNYLLVGLARLYSHNFQNAIQTFKYVNTKSKKTTLRHRALIYLVHTFIEQEEYNRAKEVLQFIEKEKMTKENIKYTYLRKAYYYQMVRDYDNMANTLADINTLLTKKDGKGRILLITGQLYHKLGIESKAYYYYKKCIATNPDYKIDFYARLGLLQASPISTSKNIKKIEKQFVKMLEDAKNKEFRDKIYYEWAEFEKKQGHIKETLANYKLSAGLGLNKNVQGASFLKLGELYFEPLEEYALAKTYYDSLFLVLPSLEDIEDYDRTKKRKKELEEFAKYKEIIAWQDSLLYMASMDSSALRVRLNTTLNERKKRAEERAREKENSKKNDEPYNSVSTLRTNNASTWYFDNLYVVDVGRSEFQRIWGTIPLEDDWRRSRKTPQTKHVENEIIPIAKQDIIPEKEPEKTTDNIVEKIFMQLPNTDKKKQQAMDKMQDAYFHLGSLFWNKWNKKEKAIASYKTSLERFPHSDRTPEALFKLYLITLSYDSIQAGNYYQQLVSDYPDSDFTKTLLNPNYKNTTHITIEKQKKLYRTAYINFKKGHIKESEEELNEAFTLGTTTFTPQLELLQILLIGETENLFRYQKELNAFLTRHPKNKLAPYANKLLNASKNLNILEGAEKIRYTNTLNEPHCFTLVYTQSSNLTDSLINVMDHFIRQNDKEATLNTNYQIFDSQHKTIIVCEFSNLTTSLYFLKKFNTESTNAMLAKQKINTFVITKSNLDVLRRTKALNKYLAFFNRYYKHQNP